MALYCTPAELRTQIEKQGTTGAGADDALNLIIEAASRTIDRHCNRPDGFVALSTATMRYYTGLGKAYLLIDECVAVTAVSVKDSPSDTTYTAWSATDYQACTGDPEYPDWNKTPYSMIVRCHPAIIAPSCLGSTMVPACSDCAVTAKWGYSVEVHRPRSKRPVSHYRRAGSSRDNPPGLTRWLRLNLAACCISGRTWTSETCCPGSSSPP